MVQKLTRPTPHKILMNIRSIAPSPLLVIASLWAGVLFCGLALRTVAASDRPRPQLAADESSSSVAMAPTEMRARTRLEEAGYSGIRNLRSGPEGISATAMKDGRELSLVIDSGGRIRQLIDRSQRLLGPGPTSRSC